MSVRVLCSFESRVSVFMGGSSSLRVRVKLRSCILLVCSPTCTSRPKRGFFASLIAGPAVVPQTPDHHRTSNSFSQDLLDFMMAEANEGVVQVSLPSTPSPRQTVFPQANPMSALKKPPGSATERAKSGKGGSPTPPQLLSPEQLSPDVRRTPVSAATGPYI
jgi:hypothetical protein